jgi:hypothetical protein
VPYFTDFKGLLHALEEVRAVAEPLHGLFQAHRSAASQLEGAEGEQSLAGTGKAHKTGGGGLGQPFYFDGFGSPCHIFRGVLAQEDFTQVDSQPSTESTSGLLFQTVQGAMIGKGVAYRWPRALEEEQETGGFIDLPALPKGEKVPGQAVVASEELCCLLVTEPLHQLRAVDQVAQQKRFEDGNIGAHLISSTGNLDLWVERRLEKLFDHLA